MTEQLIAFDETDAGVHAELSQLDGICSLRFRNERGGTLDGFEGSIDNAFRFLLVCSGKAGIYPENPSIGDDGILAYGEDWTFVSATFGRIDAPIVVPIDVDPVGFSIWMTDEYRDTIQLTRYDSYLELHDAISEVMRIFQHPWTLAEAPIGITIIAPGGNSPEFVNG